MDLLAPCRRCLQCLPFLDASPPPSPRPAAVVPSSSSPYSQEALKATATDPSQSSEELPCSNAATAPQGQDLPPPRKEEEEPPQDVKCDKDEVALPASASAISTSSLSDDVEGNKTPTLSELLLQVGSMPIPSPAPPGAGYPAGDADAEDNNGDPHYDQIDDVFPASPLETFQSVPNLEPTVGVENSAIIHTNGASALLETYHSDAIVLSEDAHDDDDGEQDEVVGHSGSHPPHRRRRRRDHFKEQFKGIRQQIKQGGHHVVEEGSKHMKTIIDNINKQAQQREQSGSFFAVPNTRNN